MLLLQLILITGVKSDCYNWQAKPALDTPNIYTGGTELVSCGKGTNNCCLRGEECGTNLLCRAPGGSIRRQYCADQFWANCSSLAREQYPKGGVVMRNCGDNIFTWTASNCTAGPFFFVNPINGAVTTQSVSSGTIATASYWSVDTAAALASQSAASLSSAQATLTSSSGLATPTSSTSSQTSLMPTQISSPSSTSKLSAGAGTGIGIGAAAAVAGMAVLGWLWMRERKKRRALQGSGQPYAPATSETANNSSYPNDTYKVAYAQHHELAAQYPPQELANNGQRNEVP